MGGISGALRGGGWLTRDRIPIYLTILAFGNVLGTILIVCRLHGWLPPALPHTAPEFLSFFAAGRLVDTGPAAAVYTPAAIASFAIPPALRAMQVAVSGDPRIGIYGFFYPPVYWLICAPLARLGFYPACFVWIALTAGGLAIALRGILGSWGRLLPAAAFLAVWENAGVGENAFLTAGLLAFGLLNLEARPVRAGFFFGALCYKPHFLLPVGVMLLAGEHWRAIAGTVACAMALCVFSAALFGWDAWRDYVFNVVPHAEWVFAHGGVSYAIQVTPSSAVRLLGGSLAAGNAARLCGLAFGAYCLVAARRAPPNVAAAMLTASFPLFASVMLDYDLTICGLAIAFLVRQANETGFLAWEKTALAAMFCLPAATWLLRANLHIPVDVPVIIGFMAVLLARTAIISPAPRAAPE